MAIHDLDERVGRDGTQECVLTLHVRGEVLDTPYVVARHQRSAYRFEVDPFVGRALHRAVVEVEGIDVEEGSGDHVRTVPTGSDIGARAPSTNRNYVKR